jgi:hypothetical protein
MQIPNQDSDLTRGTAARIGTTVGSPATDVFGTNGLGTNGLKKEVRETNALGADVLAAPVDVEPLAEPCEFFTDWQLPNPVRTPSARATSKVPQPPQTSAPLS